RRDQPAAVVEPHRDVARRAGREPTLEERAAEADDLLAQLRLVHAAPPAALPANTAAALSKKSGAPKLPDLSASASGPLRVPDSAGTPGSISGPMSSRSISSALTTAPDVSPPATTMRFTPRLLRMTASSPKKPSIASATASRP